MAGYIGKPAYLQAIQRVVFAATSLWTRTARISTARAINSGNSSTMKIASTMFSQTKGRGDRNPAHHVPHCRIRRLDHGTTMGPADCFAIVPPNKIELLPRFSLALHDRDRSLPQVLRLLSARQSRGIKISTPVNQQITANERSWHFFNPSSRRRLCPPELMASS